METHLTQENTKSEYCHASVILDYVDFLYLEDGNVYIPVLKIKPQLYFLKKPFIAK